MQSTHQLGLLGLAAPQLDAKDRGRSVHFYAIHDGNHSFEVCFANERINEICYLILSCWM